MPLLVAQLLPNPRLGMNVGPLAQMNHRRQPESATCSLIQRGVFHRNLRKVGAHALPSYKDRCSKLQTRPMNVATVATWKAHGNAGSDYATWLLQKEGGVATERHILEGRYHAYDSGTSSSNGGRTLAQISPTHCREANPSVSSPSNRATRSHMR